MDFLANKKQISARKATDATKQQHLLAAEKRVLVSVSGTAVQDDEESDVDNVFEDEDEGGVCGDVDNGDDDGDDATT